jgi:preprotein translocase subunit SecD
MTIRWQRFNLYLLMALMAAAVCGCRTSREAKARKLLSTLRLHVEASLDRTKASEPIPVYREKPIWVNVTKAPFLTEADVEEAKVVDVVGGFALCIKFDGPGTAILEEYTAANRGKKIAVFSQFGKQIKDYRWLAAPMIARRIADGVFTFTPDATREEAEEIANGLNNVSKMVRHKWVDH